MRLPPCSAQAGGYTSSSPRPLGDFGLVNLRFRRRLAGRSITTLASLLKTLEERGLVPGLEKLARV